MRRPVGGEEGPGVVRRGLDAAVQQRVEARQRPAVDRDERLHRAPPPGRRAVAGESGEEAEQARVRARRDVHRRGRAEHGLHAVGEDGAPGSGVARPGVSQPAVAPGRPAATSWRSNTVTSAPCSCRTTTRWTARPCRRPRRRLGAALRREPWPLLSSSKASLRWCFSRAGTCLSCSPNPAGRHRANGTIGGPDWNRDRCGRPRRLAGAASVGDAGQGRAGARRRSRGAGRGGGAAGRDRPRRRRARPGGRRGAAGAGRRGRGGRGRAQGAAGPRRGGRRDRAAAEARAHRTPARHLVDARHLAGARRHRPRLRAAAVRRPRRPVLPRRHRRGDRRRPGHRGGRPLPRPRLLRPPGHHRPGPRLHDRGTPRPAAGHRASARLRGVPQGPVERADHRPSRAGRDAAPARHPGPRRRMARLDLGGGADADPAGPRPAAPRPRVRPRPAPAAAARRGGRRAAAVGRPPARRAAGRRRRADAGRGGR